MFLRRVRGLRGVFGGARAFYYSDPVPCVSLSALRAEVEGAQSRRALQKAMRGQKGTRNWLSEREQEAFGAARRSGVLQLFKGCSNELTQHFHRWCFQKRRPFLALNIHGQKLFVDASPAGGGLGADAEVDGDRVSAFLSVLGGEVATMGGRVLLHGVGAEKEAVSLAEEERVEGGVEAGKSGLLGAVEEVCVLSGRDRGDMLGLARRVFDRWAGEVGEMTADDVHAAKVTRAKRRAWRREEIHRLVLRKARDAMPEVRLNLPKEAFGPFSAAEESGTAVSTPGPRMPFPKSHYFDKKGRLRKGVRDPKYAFLLEEARKEAMQEAEGGEGVATGEEGGDDSRAEREM